ncbi:MAG: hypothetical protein AAGD10_02725 [Myxococcota bacterium]
MRARSILGLGVLCLGLPAFWFACSEDRECVTDGDCGIGRICSRLGQCGGGSIVTDRDAGTLDLGDSGGVTPIVDIDIPDIDIGQVDMDMDVVDMDIVDMDMDIVDMGMDIVDIDMGAIGMVGPPIPVPALTVLTQDVRLEVERVSSSGSQVLRATAGARVDPSSRNCTDTVGPSQNGVQGQTCVIMERDCDGPGTALPTGMATHTFALSGGNPQSFTQITTALPTWAVNTISSTGLFTSPVGVILEMSTAGDSGGLVAIPATEVPTPRDFQAVTPDPMLPGTLDLTANQQINFNTTTGTGAVYFELFDLERTFILRCEAPVAGATFFAFDNNILDDYRDALPPALDTSFSLEIGFDEAVTREVLIVGGGTTEVAFNFKWISRYTQVAP